MFPAKKTRFKKVGLVEMIFTTHVMENAWFHSEKTLTKRVSKRCLECEYVRGEESEEEGWGYIKTGVLLTWQNQVLHGSLWTCGLHQLDARIFLDIIIPLVEYVVLGVLKSSYYNYEHKKKKRFFLSPLAVFGIQWDWIYWLKYMHLFLKSFGLCLFPFSAVIFCTWSLCVGYLLYIHELWFFLF